MNKKERTQHFIAHFLEHMPEAKTELDYTNVFELTVAVLLSEQCTDKRINIITKTFYRREIKYCAPLDDIARKIPLQSKEA